MNFYPTFTKTSSSAYKNYSEKVLRIHKSWKKTKQGIPLKTEDMNYKNRWTTMMYACD